MTYGDIGHRRHNFDAMTFCTASGTAACLFGPLAKGRTFN
jgi:hypothetical protein